MGSEVATCEFCAIARGEDHSANVVCEADDWVAFFPTEPATPGHTMVIPRVHVPDLWALDDPALGAEVMAAVIRVGRAIQAAVQPEGLNLISSAGAVAEQTVFHMHLHVVPRWRRDGFDAIWAPATQQIDDESRERLAVRIREACASF